MQTGRPSRNREKILFINQINPQPYENRMLRLNEAISGRVRCPVQLNGHDVSALCDTGNTYRAVGSKALLKQLGLTTADLQSTGQAFVGSAATGTKLKILGETRRPVTIQLPGLAQKFKFKLVFLEQLDHPLNLGTKFLKAIKASWDFKKDALLFPTRIVPLADEEGKINSYWIGKSLAQSNTLHCRREHAPERPHPPEPLAQAVLARDHVLLPGQPHEMCLKVLEQPHPLQPQQDLIIEGLWQGANAVFQNNRPVVAALNVVGTLDQEGHIYSQAINISQKKIRLKKGTPFANIFEAEVHQPKSQIEKVANLANIAGRKRNHQGQLLSPVGKDTSQLQDRATDAVFQPLNLSTVPKVELERMKKDVREKLELGKSVFCQQDPKVQEQLTNLLCRYYHVFSWDGSPGECLCITFTYLF